MKVGAAIAEIMKREGFDMLFAYPVNHLIEYAAELDIRSSLVLKRHRLLGEACRACANRSG